MKNGAHTELRVSRQPARTRMFKSKKRMGEKATEGGEGCQISPMDCRSRDGGEREPGGLSVAVTSGGKPPQVWSGGLGGAPAVRATARLRAVVWSSLSRSVSVPGPSLSWASIVTCLSPANHGNRWHFPPLPPLSRLSVPVSLSLRDIDTPHSSRWS